jgi:hypothetical protein
LWDLKERSANEYATTSRTTLSLPQWTQRTPFDKYKGITSPQPLTNPYRFIHRKLGITAAEFDAKVAQEIDDLLQEIENERRQALLESLPLGCALSKADCRKLFPQPPASGSLLGVYNWAHDIDLEFPANDDPPLSHD